MKQPLFAFFIKVSKKEIKKYISEAKLCAIFMKKIAMNAYLYSRQSELGTTKNRVNLPVRRGRIQ